MMTSRFDMIKLSEEINKIIELDQDTRLNTGMHPSAAATDCKRCLWLKFRNVKKERFDGRRLRIFETGNIYESRIISYINNLNNWEVRDCQKSIESGIVRGNIDGIAVNNGIKYLLEIKTSAQRYFSKLLKSGVKEAFIKHYIQIQIYMMLLGLKKTIYLCVNKNTDEIYEEIVELDESQANMYIHRIKEIAYEDSIPDKISENPAYFICKSCPYHKFCHEGEQIMPTCRGCESFYLEDDKGKCRSFERFIPIEFQHKKQNGLLCKRFTVHPDLKYSDCKIDKLESDIKKYFGDESKRVL